MIGACGACFVPEKQSWGGVWADRIPVFDEASCQSIAPRGFALPLSKLRSISTERGFTSRQCRWFAGLRTDFQGADVGVRA
jgi:hypothetical protein